MRARLNVDLDQSRTSRRHQFVQMQIERTFAAVSADQVWDRSILQDRKHVLVVDDDPGTLRAIARLLRQQGYETLLFHSAEAFENHIDFEEAFCVLLDINLNSGRSGMDLRHRLKEAGHSVPVIYMTGNDTPAVHNAALQSGCLAYLVKPVLARSLIEALERVSGLGQLNA
jgi:FixJ family two-component response regulator